MNGSRTMFIVVGLFIGYLVFQFQKSGSVVSLVNEDEVASEIVNIEVEVDAVVHAPSDAALINNSNGKSAQQDKNDHSTVANYSEGEFSSPVSPIEYKENPSNLSSDSYSWGTTGKAGGEGGAVPEQRQPRSISASFDGIAEIPEPEILDQVLNRNDHEMAGEEPYPFDGISGYKDQPLSDQLLPEASSSMPAIDDGIQR